MLTRVVVAIADDDDDAPGLNRLAVNRFAAGAGEIDRIEQSGAATRLQLVNLVDQRRRILCGVYRYLSVLRVGYEIAGILRISGEEILNQLLGCILEVFPMDAALRAHIEQEANDHRLIPF